MSNIGTENRGPEKQKPAKKSGINWKAAFAEIGYWLSAAWSWIVWGFKVLWVVTRRVFGKIGEIEPTLRAMSIALCCVLLAGMALSIDKFHA